MELGLERARAALAALGLEVFEPLLVSTDRRRQRTSTYASIFAARDDGWRKRIGWSLCDRIHGSVAEAELRRVARGVYLRVLGGVVRRP
jgi:hypothetical protein